MVMVDQRNHGASSEVKGFHPPHSIQASAGDLLQLVQTKLSGRTPDLLVGHSLGGKTVLELLRQLQDSGQHVPKQVSMCPFIAHSTQCSLPWQSAGTC